MIDSPLGFRGTARPKGAVLVGVVIVMLVLVILTPALIYLVQQESRAAVKAKRSTNAFYAAEAGIDRSVYELRRSSKTFDDALLALFPAGYKGDVIYTDVQDGAYIVLWSSTSVKNEIRVQSNGRDKDKVEFRTIVVLLKKDSVEAAVYAPALTVFGSAKVFWGPIMSQSELVIQGSANEMYPRKLSRGVITRTGGGACAPSCNGWDSAPGCGYCDRDESSNSPNSDGKEWYSFNASPGVPDPPNVDLAAYRTDAKAETGCPAGGSSCTPAGNTTCCYYTTDQQWDNHQTMTSHVYFFETKAKFTGSKHFRGTMIVMQNLDFVGSGKSGDGINDYGCYIATTPALAWQEYQKNTPAGGDNCNADCGAVRCKGGCNGCADDGDYDNGAAAEKDDEWCHEYPGDEGLKVVGNYKFCTGCTAHNNIGGGESEPISFKGFIYGRDTIQVGGSVAIHGAILTNADSFSGGGSISIWYDDDLKVKLTSINFKQTSWKELPGRSF